MAALLCVNSETVDMPFKSFSSDLTETLSSLSPNDAAVPAILCESAMA